MFHGRSAAAQDRRCAGLGREGRGAAGRGGDRPQRRRPGQRRALKSSLLESPDVGDCGAQTKEKKLVAQQGGEGGIVSAPLPCISYLQSWLVQQPQTLYLNLQQCDKV